MRRFIPGRALVALALIAVLGLLSPGLAQARPNAPERAPAERSAPAKLLAQVWSLLTHLWGAEGSGLDPNGKTSPAGIPGGGGSTVTGDTGSGLDPDGSR